MDALHSEHRRLAVLIDAENASASSIAPVMAEIASYGTSIIRRAYGDWTTTRLASWKRMLLEYAIQPIQQFSYTTGKNATDGALIIDAMDLLYSRKVAGFCIVSSDSDFTRLCTRLREADMVVLGFGNRQTPRSFVAACHRFVYPAAPVADAVTNTTATPPPTKRLSTKQLQADEQLVRALLLAAAAFADAQGWSTLSRLDQQIKAELPGFSPKRYGFARFLKLLEATELFVIEKRNKSEMVARLRKRLAGEVQAIASSTDDAIEAERIEPPAVEEVFNVGEQHEELAEDTWKSDEFLF